LKDDYLFFNDINLKELIDTYGTPFKMTYLPKISAQVKKARYFFQKAMHNCNYQGNYSYCYCTKASHFRYILDEVLQNQVEVETSSSFDMDLLKRLYHEKKITKKTTIVNNGFKTKDYLQKICGFINQEFQNMIPVLDNMDELDFYRKHVNGACKIGIRIATEEEPNFQFYTSRLGIRQSEVISFYKEKIATSSKFKLKMLHFFVDTGIKDSIYYWNEFKKCIKIYCELRAICPDLRIINIGGGLPIKNSLGFEYDYEYMINEIVSLISQACKEDNIPEPDIFTEFGSYTIGESGALIFSVIGQKQQNDAELWYMVDNSVMNTLPDTWGIDQRYIILPINKWSNEYQRVNVGGITCDNSDYYNSEAHISQLYLPRADKEESEPLYVGFFHTGAYQDALTGYGGIKHCLIPSPKHILVDKDEDGNLVHWLNFKEQTSEAMLRVLGY
jgi:arginine decarboxylase